MQTKISVIITIYNNEKRIEHCVKSVMAQSYSNIEIILIDDGSSDFSVSFCDDIRKKDRRIILVHQIHQGRLYSQLEGLRISSGEYVLFVDGNDFVSTRLIENLYESCEKRQAPISVAAIGIVGNDGCIFKCDGRDMYENLEGKLIKKGLLKDLNDNIDILNNNVDLWGLAFDKATDVVENSNGIYYVWKKQGKLEGKKKRINLRKISTHVVNCRLP